MDDVSIADVAINWSGLMRPEDVRIAKSVHKRLPKEFRLLFKAAPIIHIDNDSVLITYPVPPSEQAAEITELLRSSRPAIEKAFKKVLNYSVYVKFRYLDFEQLAKYLLKDIEENQEQ